MKPTTVLLLAAAACLSLCGCAVDFQSSASERISDIPTLPHDKDVEIYFAGEWPKEEYVKIAALEARGSENTPYAQLIKSLKTKAQKHGADAIVVQNKEFISDVSSSSSTRTVSTSTYSELHGIAIKYKKNLDLTLMPKLQQVQVFDANTQRFEPLLNLQLTYGGGIEKKEELKPDAMSLYNSYIQPFTTYHLLYEQSPYWSYQEQQGYVIARQLTRNNLVQKRVTVAYNLQKQISKIDIDELGKAKKNIEYEYDSDGKLSARYIYRDNILQLIEKYSYNASGLVEQVKVYTSTEQGETPLLQSAFAYYTLDEVK